MGTIPPNDRGNIHRDKEIERGKSKYTNISDLPKKYQDEYYGAIDTINELRKQLAQNEDATSGPGKYITPRNTIGDAKKQIGLQKSNFNINYIDKNKIPPYPTINSLLSRKNPIRVEERKTRNKKSNSNLKNYLKNSGFTQNLTSSNSPQVNRYGSAFNLNILQHPNPNNNQQSIPNTSNLLQQTAPNTQQSTSNIQENMCKYDGIEYLKRKNLLDNVDYISNSSSSPSQNYERSIGSESYQRIINNIANNYNTTSTQQSNPPHTRQSNSIERTNTMTISAIIDNAQSNNTISQQQKDNAKKLAKKIEKHNNK